MSYWQQQAEPIIAKVIAEVGTGDPVKLRKAIREAYPFGERKYHPYKIWCREVKRQLLGTPAKIIYITREQASLKPACINCKQRTENGDCEVERRPVADLDFCRFFSPIKLVPRESNPDV